MMLPSFKITIGPSEAGWCDYQVSLKEKSWKCKASYIAEHPIHELLVSIISLHYYLFVDDSMVTHPRWDAKAIDEPGGICIRLTPDSDHKIHVAVFQNLHDKPDPDSSPKVQPVGETSLDFWELAASIHETAQECLTQQSLTELRIGWLMDSHAWASDYHSIFPLEHFFYLSALLNKEPKIVISQKGTRKIIHQIHPHEIRT